MIHNRFAISTGGVGEASVDGDIDRALGVLVLTVEVATLGGLTDTVEAVYLEMRREWKTAFERVDPFAEVTLVVVDFSGRMCDAMGVVFQHLLLVPGIGISEEIIKAFFNGQVARRVCGVAFSEVDEGAEADFLPRDVVGSPCCIAPDGVAAFGKHA